MNIKASKIAIVGVSIGVGLIMGWLIFGSSAEPEVSSVKSGDAQIWTCSMHPQVRQPAPGDCPICGMDLIPFEEDSGSGSELQLEMTENAMKIAQIRTTTAEFIIPKKSIVLHGVIEPDERAVSEQIAHFSGRIEKLYVNYSGQYIKKGDRLANVYSPELLTAQKELLEAAKIRNEMPELYQAARKKLTLMKISDNQIDEIADSGRIVDNIDIIADHSGYVIELNSKEGEAFQKGSELMTIASLDQLWAMMDVYESDLTFVSVGDEIELRSTAYPGLDIAAEIGYIDPVINPKTRTASARVVIKNRNMKLKPGMYVRGIVTADLKNIKEALAIRKSAVMWTGKRSIVYVKMADTEKPTFEFREVDLGPDLGDKYVILSGITAGEEVVVQGAFNLDAAAQLNNKMSMMNYQKMAEDADDSPDFAGEIPDKFKSQLSRVIDEYLKITTSLVNAKSSIASKNARGLLNALSKADMTLLNTNAHAYWMLAADSIKSTAELILNSSNIDEQREAFIGLSNNMIKVAKAFRTDQKLYLQFCPMANDDKGAAWLSKQKEILNPYFGDMMLHCGETKETLHPQ
ncbi:MAG: efflux RND transporter periplasmic adaptor subunit [Candidatus Kapaibacterium sp.]